MENQVILADEPAYFGVIIPALQIIQSAFGVVIISAVTHAGVPTSKNCAAGLISDENYVAFTNRYQSEQAEIQEKIAVLDAKLDQQTDYQANAEQLREAISDYLNIDTLTPFILNKLIENIQVRHAEAVNSQIVQEVTIVWRFAGGDLGVTSPLLKK